MVVFGWFEVTVLVDAKPRLREIDGSGIFLIWSLRPISMTSVLEKFTQRRF